MKAFCLVALSVIMFSACTRQDSSSVQPDRARQMAGTYQVNLMTFQVGSQPAFSVPLPLQYNGQPAMTAAITIARKSESLVDQTLALTFNKAALPPLPANVDPLLLDDKSFNFEDMEIRNNGTGYDLYANGKKIAYFDDNTYTVQRVITDPNTGETYTVSYRATK